MSLAAALAQLTTNWKPVLEAIWAEVGAPIEEAYAKAAYTAGVVYPPRDQVFRAFDMFNVEETRMVILGQDPYIKAGEAMGLAFSVPNGVTMPPSLRNVFKELHRTTGVERTSTDLTDWAQQGVLLLNTALTVPAGQSGAHTSVWSPFTTRVMGHLVRATRHVVFLLWGAHAQGYGGIVETWVARHAHLVLTWSHPSPLSRRPFTGCNHFAETNTFLEGHGKPPIKWV